MFKKKLTHEEYIKKLEHQMYLAQEHPARIYDLSDCNITQVPRGVFSFCKVLRKYSLNLRSNNLSSLDSGGSLDDLKLLGALILSNNLFKSLPNGLNQLLNLQKLIMDNNKLQKFPVVLTELPCLKIVSLEANAIKVIPKDVVKFKQLETLNILFNPLVTVASEICLIKSLKVLNVSFQTVKLSKDVKSCEFNEVWTYFCTVNKIPVSNISTEVYVESTCEENDISSTSKYTKMGDKIEKEAQKHDQKLLDLERDNQLKNLEEIRKLSEMEDEVIKRFLTSKYESEKVFEKVKYEEMSALDLIDEINEITKQMKKIEELKNRALVTSMRFLDRVLILSDEERNDVINSMQSVFKEKLISRQNSEAGKLYSVPTTLEILKDMSLQKEALKLFEVKQDSQISRLTDTIELIEKKLKHVSLQEISGGIFSSNTISSRSYLVSMLNQLKNEITLREQFIYDRIDRLECPSSYVESDFWFIRYRRRMDYKTKCESEVDELLKIAGLSEWTYFFHKYDYTVEMLLELTEDDLAHIKEIPTHIRSRFLQFINEWKFNPIKTHSDVTPSAPVAFEAIEGKWSESNSVIPSAPTPPEITKSISMVKDDQSVVVARMEVECCICLTLEAKVLLLNCGHVCCCKDCSLTVRCCPLCRQQIVQRVNLDFQI